MRLGFAVVRNSSMPYYKGLVLWVVRTLFMAMS